MAVLNFASAKNPAGGFLKGSNAQEESLARASALYPCTKQMNEMYEANRNYDSGLYLNYMIYSPFVPVFRAEKGQLLNKPYFISIITAPAVNAGVVKSRESKKNIDKIAEVMLFRIKKILSLALIHQIEALVLGAFGCGVFKNDPEEVASYFKKIVLEDKRFKNIFKKIVFAVLDKSSKKDTYKAFLNKLA